MESTITGMEFSSGHVITNNNINNRNSCTNNNNALPRRRRRRRVRGYQSSGHQRGMTEEITKTKTVGAPSPGSDCNSNHTSNIVIPSDKNGEITASYISNASSQDVDFIQDNSDYQWFLDYGYRDGSSAPHHLHHHHASVLSSLATSYACDDLSYYDDMARNLDANLAEVDMEDFRTEDIHSILTTLPTMCCGELQSEREGEMFASVSGSMMAKFDFDSSISPHTSSQAEDSAGSTDTMSICKSELLFSPVKECPLPSTNFSVDSLDCDLLTEHDIMLTCQANKDNYTIAFEGSMTLYSEDSDYHEAGESETTSGSHNWSSARFVHPSSVRNGGSSRPLDTSMARSDSVYTTWSKLKKRSSEVQLSRHPSGNNNTTYPEGTSIVNFQPVDATALKSQSMPNLSRERRRCLLTSMSSKLSSAMSSSMESEPRTRPPGIGGCVKLYDVQHHHNSSILLSAHSETNSSMDGASSCSGSGGGSRKQHNFSLVKLFMKQKSVSNEGMCYAMDQSSASECWPTSNNSQSEGESDSYNQGSARQRSCPVISNSMNGGRGLCAGGDSVSSACGCLNDCRCERHHTENACDNGNKTREDYGSENGNGPKTAMTDTLDGATNNWIQVDDTATDYSTCCFEDSLVEPCKKEESYINRHHDLIEEEEERDSERSESVEQLSESVSKIEESTLDMGINSCISDQQEEQCSNSSHSNMYNILKPKCYSTVAKNITLFNVNNNNSIEKEDIQTYGKQKSDKGQNQGTQTKRASSLSNLTPSESESISHCSSSEDTEPTRLHNLSPTKRNSCGSPTSIATTKNTSTQVPVHLMHRSIQTSGYSDISSLKSAPFKLLESPNGTSLVKIILPSTKILPGDDLSEDETKKPVYVFYPNYTLPDLAFLKEKNKEVDIAKVFLMPQKFSSTHPQEPDKGSHQSTDKSKTPQSSTKNRRPFSCNDVEALRKKGFAHIRDWDSLTFLLPREYRQILAEVPEIVHNLKGNNEDSLRPLFCVSPPLRSGNKITRPLSCDCACLVASDGKFLPPGSNIPTNVSSSSSTATQPSSGYRGSSTILTDSSSNHNPSNYNPLFVYRYDSVSSESSMMMNQQKPISVVAQQPSAPPLPKRSISLPTGAIVKNSHLHLKHGDTSINQPTPPRPPLPRGILRKSMEGSNNAVHYKCKAHKNNANSKRYSMFELGNRPDYSKEDKNVVVQDKRRSLQDVDFIEFASPRKTIGSCKFNDVRRRISSEKDVDEMEAEYDDEGVDAGTESSFEEAQLDYQVRPPTPPIPKTPEVEDRCYFNVTKTECEEDETLQLEELLQMSGLSVVCSGESPKEWNETDVMKLRQQVSKFLSTKQSEEISPQHDDDESNPARTPYNTPEHHGTCDCCTSIRTTGGKKTVSFAEKVCIHVRETGTPTEASDQAVLYTPPNSPSVSTNLGMHRTYQCKINPSLAEMPIREEKESSPDGYSSPPSEGTRVAVVPNISIAQHPIAVDLAQKRALVTAVSDAVEQVICHFSAAENQAHCSLLGDSSHTPACAQLVLSNLCPALYAVMSDGLRPTLDTAFGSIQNSVWQVVEASAQQGPMTKALNELVLRLNGEDVLTEGLMKFNAFVFGLLNVRSLDAWAGYLRTRESVLRKHYMAEGLLLLANTAGASVRALTDQLLASLQPLSLLPFKLDLLFEVRQLHHSLRRMGSLPPDITGQQPGTSPSPTNGKPWTLMKLVRSIQSSLSQSVDEDNQASWQHRKAVSSDVPPRTEEPTHHPNCASSSADSPPLPDLLDSSSCTYKPWTGEGKPRPRSCVDNTVQGAGGFSLVTDIASTVKRRWSGIQLGSKLFQAFDRLAAEDTEEEYTDSLENKPRPNMRRKRHTSSSSNNSTSDDYADNITRDKSVSPAPVENIDCEDKKTEDENVEDSVQERRPSGTEGGKFKRLQMKWEMLSGRETYVTEKVNAKGSTSPETNNVTGSTNSIANVRSKIPRPVTSPIRASGIPILSPQQSSRTKASAITPPTPSGSAQLRRPSNISVKYKMNSPGAKENNDTKDSAIKPQTGKSGNVNIASVTKRQPSGTTRCSRVDQLHSEEHTARGHIARPSSLPYRPANVMQGNKTGQTGNKVEVQRRAASSSLNRQRHTDNQARPRYVRTLCHRLPSDSGHLSFNEGERLRLVLEVDEKWLLCCRGDQKGLVPRTAVNAGLVPRQAVIAVQDNVSRF